MSKGTGRYGWVARLARIMLAATLVALSLLLVGSIVGVVDEIFRAVASPRGDGGPHGTVGPAIEWVLAVVTPLLAMGWLFVGVGVIQALLAQERNAYAATGRLERIESLLEAQAASARQAADLAVLSDQAKSLLYRDREIEVIRETIHEDLMRQDYEAAEALAAVLADKSGYADEAARLRDEIESSRQATVEEKLDGAVQRIEKIMERQDWPRAMREAKRLVTMFPESSHVAALPQRVIDKQTRHKRSLLQEYGEAVRRNDVERGIELLKELDRYLTPQEAAALAESARGVFRAKLHNLGVQFAISVAEEQWADAVAGGEEIVREFPNSRMAREVQEKMDLLRSRAQGGAAE